MLWCALEAPHRGASNEHSQRMISSREKDTIMWLPLLSGALHIEKKNFFSLFKRTMNKRFKITFLLSVCLS